jgi:hypothetical protein
VLQTHAKLLEVVFARMVFVLSLIFHQPPLAMIMTPALFGIYAMLDRVMA